MEIYEENFQYIYKGVTDLNNLSPIKIKTIYIQPWAIGSLDHLVAFGPTKANQMFMQMHHECNCTF